MGIVMRVVPAVRAVRAVRVVQKPYDCVIRGCCEVARLYAHGFGPSLVPQPPFHRDVPRCSWKGCRRHGLC